jgi:hypothetical protein
MLQGILDDIKKLKKSIGGALNRITALENNIELYYYVSNPAINAVAVTLYCNGSQANYIYTNTNSSDMTSLLEVLNGDPLYTAIGTYTNIGNNYVKLTTTKSIKEQYCPSGVISFSVQAD